MGANVNSSSGDGASCTSADELEMYFGSNRSSGRGNWDIWVCKRQTIHDPWGPAENLGAPINSQHAERYPSLTADGLTLYFSDAIWESPRPGGRGQQDLWLATRPSRSEPWHAPVNVGGPVNSASIDCYPSVSGDGLILVFTSMRAGGRGGLDLWMSTRSNAADPWGAPSNLSSVNTPSQDLECGLSADGLALVFCSNRANGVGSYDIWMTTRKSRQDPWLPAMNLGPRFNGPAEEGSPGFSAGMNTLFYDSNGKGGFGDYDKLQAPIIPQVDFNSDYLVDISDLLMLIENWGQPGPSLDMGPHPWGDGVINAADLEVLMGYWGKDVYDPHLLAHWALDEFEGEVAYDSAGENDAQVLGHGVWDSDGGQIQGALALSGDKAFLSTPLVLNPADTVFSVFAWIKGGMPGQVILSQESGVNWLMADVGAGELRTDLSDPVVSSRRGTSGGMPLIGPAVIADGNWHCVGLVWDGSHRILYVDDLEIARDTVNNLEQAHGAFYIGTGSGLEAGLFWSGMIDDVRIYNRVVKP